MPAAEILRTVSLFLSTSTIFAYPYLYSVWDGAGVCMSLEILGPFYAYNATAPPTRNGWR